MPMGPEEKAFYEEVSDLEDYIEESVRRDGLDVTSRLVRVPLPPAKLSKIDFRIEVFDPANPTNRDHAEWNMAEGAKGKQREALFAQARREVSRQLAIDRGPAGWGIPHVDHVLFDMEKRVRPSLMAE